MERRRELLTQAAQIPIGKELFQYDSLSNEYGVYLSTYTLGTDAYSTSPNSGNIITAWLPYNSDFIFAFSGNSNSPSGLAVLADNNFIIYQGNATRTLLSNLQAEAKTAERLYGVKLRWIKVTCTTENYNNGLISYKRIL